MFHKAVDLKLLEGTKIQVTFQNGVVKCYDMKNLFSKYPQLRELENRDLFLSGKLMGYYGIIWNDDLDIETETIYEDGETIHKDSIIHKSSSNAVSSARAAKSISQKELAELTGIDQSDISKIERGVANPSVATLERIAIALGGELVISITKTEEPIV